MVNKPEWLQPGYVLDESNPDLLVLRRADGWFVAAFYSRGATKEGILEAAEKDRREREQRKRVYPRRRRHHRLPS